MTPSEIKKELIHTAQQLDAMRSEIMAIAKADRNPGYRAIFQRERVSFWHQTLG
jgi:hypothetical protein